MLFRSEEAMRQYISGVILYDETIWQNAKDGTPLVRLIEQSGAIPGIKVDEGNAKPAELPRRIDHGWPGQARRAPEEILPAWRAVRQMAGGDRYRQRHWRPEHSDHDRDQCQRARAGPRYRALCQAAQIVPIVEPEVLMDGDHDIDRCYEVSQRVLNKTFQELRDPARRAGGMILKPNMAIAGKKSAKPSSVEEVPRKPSGC